MKSGNRCVEHGSVLLIALIMVVAISILLIGFATRARLETIVSSTYSDAVEARGFAEMGLEVAAAKIATATGGGSFWASAPGRIFTMPRDNGKWGAPSVTELSSGMGGDEAHSANLNPPALLHPGGVIQGNISPLRLRWIYVRKDGAQETGNSQPAFNRDNPVVGRYAFWADDNSTRINLNTAAARDEGLSEPGHPSEIDLTSLTGVSSAAVKALQEFRASRHLLNAQAEVEEVEEVEDAFGGWTEQEALSFTLFNHSPERNVFGEPKILLTTKASRANGQEFFDITNDADADPGLFDNLNAVKVGRLFDRLYEILARTDRPFMEGKSFVQKYGERQAAQMVIDLIDYVRAADSPQVAVEPIRGTFSSASRKFALNAGAIDFLANGRKPYITQVAVRVTHPTATSWKFDYAIEVFLPEWEGGGAMDLTELRLYIGLWGGGTRQIDITDASVHGEGSLLRSGGYRTILDSFTVYSSTLSPPNPMPIHLALFSKTTTRRFDIAALGNDRIMYAYEEPAPNSVWEAKSVAVNDPIVNKRPANWTLGSSDFERAANVRPRESTVGEPAVGGALPQDTDADGNITSAGMKVPAPDAGVRSAGEIGFIHTGGKEVPETVWRTIRLQPSPSELPDWLLLDDFAAPAAVFGAGREQAVLRPQENTKGGTINLNARFYPFITEENKEIERLLPLTALLRNAQEAGGPINAARAEKVSRSILTQDLATTPYAGKLHVPDLDGVERFYLFPGQVAEIDEITKWGEASETLVRQLVPLMTTQGNVFSVYSIGQSIRQRSNGTIQVLGERNTLTVLERAGEGMRIVSQKEIEP